VSELVFRIEGVVQMDIGEWDDESAEVFTDLFLEWLEEQGLGFGGVIGVAEEEDGHGT
jgi:hypothetical protein